MIDKSDADDAILPNISFATFDADGIVTGFYQSSTDSAIPEGAVELSDAQFADLYEYQGLRRYADGQIVVYEPPPAPPTPRIVYKVDIWRRASEAEADIMDAMLDSQPARLRRMWADAQYLQSDDELYATIEAALIAQFGAPRAAELLA